MFFMPKKAKKLYEEVIAHRGLHLEYPENTLHAYKDAVKQNFAIEMDIRMLKDGTIVCFHDRYTKRLLGVPGKVANKTYRTIRKYKVKNSKEGVPTLDMALRCVNSRVTVLIEIKGFFGPDFQKALKKILDKYKGEVFFHTKNIIAYHRVEKLWPGRAFWILNVFRKRFNFLKGKAYSNMPRLPKLDDILVEAEDTAKTVIQKMWKCCNRYNSRITPDHWLLKYNGMDCQIAHRGIVDSDFPEHSLGAFRVCTIRQKVIELDVVYDKGKVVVYHTDKLSDRLGQSKSCAKKMKYEDAPTLKDVLNLVKGRVPIIIDIKDFRLFNRVLEHEITKELEGYEGEFSVQSFNPLAVMYFEKNHPSFIRGQVGHSLRGLKNLGKYILPVVNFILFYHGHPDYAVYDLDPNVHSLSKFNNIVGIPVLGYAPKSREETLKYQGYFDNFIVEGDWKQNVYGK